MLPEVQMCLDLVRERRAEVLQTLDGLNADALNWYPLPDETNSVYALAAHMLGSERQWLHELVGQRKSERDRAAEFRARGEDVTPLRSAYAAAARESEEILARLLDADMAALRGNAPNTHTVRWCILHVIEHYNEHLGQMRLTRQLWENRHARPQEI
ncbi:MAG: DUF664 domain-containing protein [Chloroflexota bacterium]|nr:DUF664 domain-containing protein [Chloroflexota bacterium]